MGPFVDDDGTSVIVQHRIHGLCCTSTDASGTVPNLGAKQVLSR